MLEGRARWCVLEADCLAVLPTMPDKSVAHVITDPPYSEGLYARTRTNKGRPELDTPNNLRHSLALASRAIGAIDDILAPVAAEMMRLVTRWLIAFHDCETTGWREEFGDWYVRTGAWFRDCPMPQISGDRPGQGFEPATIAHRKGVGRMRWNGGGKAAVWRHPHAQGVDRPDHPCPKPLSLMLELVEDYTDPDELILDPFAGSATTGVACLRLGRRFIGIEKDPKYAQLARDRLTAEDRGQSLREYRAGQLGLFADAAQPKRQRRVPILDTDPDEPPKKGDAA